MKAHPPFRSSKTTADFVASTQHTAADMIGKIEHGIDIFGLTAGQFSFIDILEHIVSSIGQCHLVIATWTAAAASIRKAEKLLQRQDVMSMRWIVDRSFKVRQPELCNMINTAFGHDAIRTSRCHAKFMLAYNHDWSIVLRTSMNLNQNPRIEDFTITESKPMLDYMKELCDKMFENISAGDNYSNRSSELAKLALPETAMVTKQEEQPLCLSQTPLIF